MLGLWINSKLLKETMVLFFLNQELSSSHCNSHSCNINDVPLTVYPEYFMCLEMVADLGFSIHKVTTAYNGPFRI